jgi:hypothetical protein
MLYLSAAALHHQQPAPAAAGCLHGLEHMSGQVRVARMSCTAAGASAEAGSG